MQRVVLFESHIMRVVLLKLKAGVKIPAHDHSIDCYMRIVKGSVYHRSFNRTEMLSANETVVIPAKTIHSVLARGDATIISRYVL